MRPYTILLTLCSVLSVYAQCPSLTYGGKTYRTVQIGNQCWMAENLSLKIDESDCYEYLPSNCRKYGRLYTWEAAKAAARMIPGWHLPTDAEWDELCEALGGTKEDNGYGGYDYPDIGTKLKQGGSSGFNALLAGRRDSGGYFSYLGSRGYFWSASPYGSSNAWRRNVDASDSNVRRYHYYRTSRFSVRLVKD